MKKIYMSRPPIYPEQRTFFEKIEYFLFKYGLCSKKIFFKWRRTFLKELVDALDLDTNKIVLTKRKKI